MKVKVLVAIIVLILIIICVIIYTGITIKQSLELYQQGTLIPFSASIDPMKMSITDPLMNLTTGQPQISCPTGYKINIVGAFAQTFDPYGECNATSSAIVQSTCNPASKGLPCVKNRDCGVGYQCNKSDDLESIEGQRQGYCGLKEYDYEDDAQQDCVLMGPNVSAQYISNLPNNGDGYYCIDQLVCKNLVNGINPVCNPTGKGDNNVDSECAIRDASAYVGSKCDGKLQCPISISDFGPLPCTGINFPPPNGNQNGCNVVFTQTPDGKNKIDVGNISDAYCKLPIIAGYPGGVPVGSDSNNPNQPSLNLGYYVHGVYTCIPDF